ncbi:CPBP family intramembrane glutamic endopeptidase [Niallia nealsonii]
MFFYTVNGAYVTIAEPSSPVLQFIGLVPLAAGIFVYLLIKKKWNYYFFNKPKITKSDIQLSLPLLVVLLIILIGSKGLNAASIADLFFMFIMQFFFVAFIEETFYRGFMLKMLLSKGVKNAVLISSFLFGITHSLQLIGGQSVEETVLQIIYAFIVGLVLSLLIINKQSIILTIAFHGCNNFFNFMGNVENHIIYDYIIIAILLFHAIFLWKSMNRGEYIRKDIHFTG